MQESNTMPDKSKIFLYVKPYAKDNKLRSFDIGAYDDHATEETAAFNAMMFDMMSAFSENHVVLYGLRYDKTANGHKRWFGKGYYPGRYSRKSHAAWLKRQLIKEEWKDGIFADVADFTEDTLFGFKYLDFDQYFYIMQENFDFELYKRTDVIHPYESIDGARIVIFPESKIHHHVANFETVYAYHKTEDFMVKIFTDVSYPHGNITINEAYMLFEALVAKLEHFLEKHGKTLEVKQCDTIPSEQS